MLKLRYIFMSFMFFLLVGVNSNARASEKTNELIQNSTNEDQSENESNEHHSGAVFTDLDFFGAFSLVNVQLQWRDLFVELSDEESDSDSSFDPNELFVESVDFLSPKVNKDKLSVSPIINTGRVVIPICTYRTINGKANFSSTQRKQSINTIAYIQNCATYEASC